MDGFSTQDIHKRHYKTYPLDRFSMKKKIV